MDLLTEYVNDNLLTKEAILRDVDDYSLYSFYIGTELELNTKYSSPLRLGDQDPSFSMYFSKYKKDVIYFKDQSTGQSGQVFWFLRLLFGGGVEPVPLKQVLLQIDSDFGLGYSDEEKATFKPQLLKKPPLRKSPIKIQITAYDKQTTEFDAYWLNLGIEQRIVDLYYAECVRVVHYIGDDHLTHVTKSLTISYEIVGHYKIYSPYEKREFKFRNDYLDVFVEGALQLRDSGIDYALITKSTKECMFLRQHFPQWDYVAGKSENVMITEFFMNMVLKKRYKKVLIWLDNDEAGQRAQQKYLGLYPWLIPIIVQADQKDPTDMYTENQDKSAVLEFIQTLIENKINGKT